MATTEVIVHPTKQLLADAGGARLVTAVLDAQAARGVAHLVLTGGSMGSAVLAAVATSPAREAIDWSAVHLWWGDERWLPAGDPERNETQNREALIDVVALDPAHVHAVEPSDSTEAATAEAAAEQYAAQLRASSGGMFDVVMLGVGPDGHVASLFPGHPGLRATGTAAIAVHDSPKPPPTRVSLTFEALGRAREVWFLVAGEDKAEAVALGVGHGPVEQTPAAGVTGTERTLWLVDREAASRLGA